MATETSELQHLQPLINAASAASELVSSAATKSYSAAKTYAPELTERIEKQSAPFIESAAPYLAPLATRAVDVGVASIKAADVKVGSFSSSCHLACCHGPSLQLSPPGPLFTGGRSACFREGEEFQRLPGCLV